jgi:ABC-2 type transport system permease protein
MPLKSNYNEKYYRSFFLGIQNAMEYRTDFFIRIFSGVFPMIIQYYLWTSIFKSSNRETIFNYTYSQLIAYSILAILTSKLVAAGFENDVSKDIKEGGLSKFIVQPISYFSYRICCFLGGKCVQMVVVISISAIVIGIMHIYMDFPIHPSQIIVFLLVLPLSLALNFIIFYCISAIAFWITEAWGIFGTVTLLGGIASGTLFPLDIFSEKLQFIFSLLPFQYVIYFPVNILSGRMADHSIWFGVGIECLWLIILFAFSKLVWKIGMKKYIAVGG